MPFETFHFSSFDEFMNFKSTDDHDIDIITMLKSDPTLDSSTTNIKFILSFGAGGFGTGEHVSFPNIFRNPSFNEKTEGVVIIAFDPQFEKTHIRDAFTSLIQSQRPINPNNYLVECIVNVYTIESFVPACDTYDPFNIRALYELQQVDSTFEYYRDHICPLDTNESTNNWIHKFKSLLEFINSRNFQLFVHNDAWHNVSSIFATNANVHEKLSVRRIETYGINFEVLPIIPHLLLNNFNNDNLYKINDIYIVPFLNKNAVIRYGRPKFNNPELLEYVRAYAPFPAVEAESAAGNSGGRRGENAGAANVEPRNAAAAPKPVPTEAVGGAGENPVIGGGRRKSRKQKKYGKKSRRMHRLKH